MFSNVQTIIMKGLKPYFVKVETDISPGLPMFEMIGYLSSEAKESRERVRTALKNSDISIPAAHITVNLSPADLRKEGTGFDLAIALAILLSMEKLPGNCLQDTLVIGELSLNGQVNGVRGVLPMVIAAKETGCKKIILPAENESEGNLIPGIELIPVSNLKETVEFLRGGTLHKKGTETSAGKEVPTFYNKKKLVPKEECTGDGNEDNMLDFEDFHDQDNTLDFADIHGQENMKRATVIAAAGLHNILYVGPPGAGKTMIASRIPTILPSLTWEESLEVTKIYSISGLLSKNQPIKTMPPFRSPHHTCSGQALAGGGRYPMPGEISLAHLGVLFLDELPEFSKSALEILRQPLEDKKICLSRATGNYTYPANFLLAAAMNPCKCGFYPDRQKCRCTPEEVRRYLGKISRPLLDRIDICVEAPAVSFEELTGKEKGESSAQMKEKVERAVEIQRKRYLGTKFHFNSDLTANSMDEFCILSKDAKKMMENVYEKMELTARAYHRIVKTARTIADLDGTEIIEKPHIAEAVYYRSLDKKYWGR